MSVGWHKIRRVETELREADMYNFRRIPHGKRFRVRFPSGDVRVLSAIVQQETLLVNEIPFIKIAERVFFAVPFQGLDEIWLRGIDVEVQEVFDTAKTPPQKKP